MALIAIDDARVWLKARWAVRGFLRHVQDAATDRRDIVDAIEDGIVADGLHLDMLEPKLRSDVMELLERVAREAFEGKHPVEVEGRVLDETSQGQYRDAAKELLGMLKAYRELVEQQDDEP